MSLGLGNSPGRKLYGLAAMPIDWANRKRGDLFEQAYNAIILVDKNNINRKAHEEHVDGIALSDDQRFTLRKALSTEQTAHTAQEGIRNGHPAGKLRVLGMINDPQCQALRAC